MSVKNTAQTRIDFGKRLKAFREKHNLSTYDLAKICKNAPNTSASTINRFELGKVSPTIYEATLPVIENNLRDWMLDKGYEIDKFEDELLELFNIEVKDMIVNRCLLNSAAVKFFGLKADPFDVDRIPGEEEIFSDPQLDEIASRVKDAVLYKRFVCVIGDVGTGKTSMKIRIARELQEMPQVIHLIYPEFFDMGGVNVGAIAGAILEEFDVKVPGRSTSRVKKIKEQLSSREKQDERVALIFDECHRLNERVLSSLKNFWELTNGAYARLLGIVLFGQKKFVEATLRDSRFREIAERIDVIEMPSIEKSARNYLAHKIAAVGGDIDKLFEPKAVERICRVARTPLALGNLTNNALMEAFKNEETTVASGMLNLPDLPQLRGMRRVA